MAVRDVLNLLTQYHSRIEAESKRLDEKHGVDRTLGLNFFDEREITRRGEKNSEIQALTDQLLTLDSTEMLKMLALYYYGRDDDSRYAEKLEYFRGREDQKGVVRTLLEKMPSWQENFSRGIGKLRNEGLTVDTI